MAVIFKSVFLEFRAFVRVYPKLVRQCTNKSLNKNFSSLRHCSSNENATPQNVWSFGVKDSVAHQDDHEENKSILEPCSDDQSSVAPYFLPTFNFAAYVNNSATLQEFVKLGVNLHTWERKKGIPQFILKLDFEKDIRSYLMFLNDVGIPASSLGKYLTKNPLIFKEAIDDLHIRVNYLFSKQFTAQMISRIVEINPYWLMFSTNRIDRRLGHFQTKFELTGQQVRELTVQQPRLITYNIDHINLITFVVKEELGFKSNEMQKLLLKRPRLWMMDQTALRKRFDYVHNEMKIPHELICVQPQVLGSREFRTKQRHLFLSFLGRAQYDPRSEGYVSLERLVAGTDAEFALNVAKSSINAFNLFLKTL